MKNTSKINLLNFDRQSLRVFFTKLGEKPFRADQIIQWIHYYGNQTFESMTNLSKKLRVYLNQHAVVRLPEIIREQISKDGTRKWLLKLEDEQAIEMVFIPEEGRGTLCISSQVGCALNCRFCATARQGFSRNLTVAEIIGQVWLAVRLLSRSNGKHDRVVTNVVLMGMGEPLLNFDNVVQAIHLMQDDLAYSFSKYRVTLSTAGIVPAIDRLAQETDIALSVSLHAPNDALRNQLVPINKKYPLKDLMAACKRYFAKDKRRKITFEYVMLDGVNDKPEHAKALVKLLQGIPSKINLIPFNPITDSPYQCSKGENIVVFRNILISAGINTITRRTRGADIQASCGQLVSSELVCNAYMTCKKAADSVQK